MGNAAKKLTETTTLEELILTKEDVQGRKLPIKQVYEVLENGEEFSPIWQEDLKAYLRMHGELFNTAKVRAYGDDEWFSLASHPTFQRRKSSGSNKVKSKKNRYHLLIRGVKQGPFSEKELKEELKNRSILYSDFVSIDGGGSWHKLHQIKGFDRRGEQSEELPASPKKRVLKKAQERSQDEFDTSNKTQMAIAGLAKIGQNAKHSKASKDFENSTGFSEIANKISSSSKFKPFLIALVPVIALIISLVIIGTEDEDPFKKDDKTKQAKVSSKKAEKRAIASKKKTTRRPPKRVRKIAKRVMKPKRIKRRTISSRPNVNPLQEDSFDDVNPEIEEEIIEEVLPEDIDIISDEVFEEEEEYAEEEEGFDDSLQDPGDDGVLQEGQVLYD